MFHVKHPLQIPSFDSLNHVFLSHLSDQADRAPADLCERGYSFLSLFEINEIRWACAGVRSFLREPEAPNFHLEDQSSSLTRPCIGEATFSYPSPGSDQGEVRWGEARAGYAPATRQAARDVSRETSLAESGIVHLFRHIQRSPDGPPLKSASKALSCSPPVTPLPSRFCDRCFT